jgi:hypothetical protein
MKIGRKSQEGAVVWNWLLEGSKNGRRGTVWFGLIKRKRTKENRKNPGRRHA